MGQRLFSTPELKICEETFIPLLHEGLEHELEQTFLTAGVMSRPMFSKLTPAFPKGRIAFLLVVEKSWRLSPTPKGYLLEAPSELFLGPKECDLVCITQVSEEATSLCLLPTSPLLGNDDAFVEVEKQQTVATTGGECAVYLLLKQSQVIRTHPVLEECSKGNSPEWRRWILKLSKAKKAFDVCVNQAFRNHKEKNPQLHINQPLLNSGHHAICTLPS